tara:strand:- start:488 stop:778 length:291 start_codon:yes stop_codon:yes gene_type:complete
MAVAVNEVVVVDDDDDDREDRFVGVIADAEATADGPLASIKAPPADAAPEERISSLIVDMSHVALPACGAASVATTVSQHRAGTTTGILRKPNSSR